VPRWLLGIKVWSGVKLRAHLCACMQSGFCRGRLGLGTWSKDSVKGNRRGAVFGHQWGRAWQKLQATGHLVQQVLGRSTYANQTLSLHT
jgi:hypothetical protein